MADPAYIDSDTGALTDGEAWVALNSQVCTSRTTSITWKTCYNDADQDVGGVNDWSQYLDLIILGHYRGTASSVIGTLNIKTYYDATASSAIDFTSSCIGQVLRNGTSTGAAYYSAARVGTVWDAGEMTGGGTSHSDGMSCCVLTLSDINSGKMKNGFCIGGSGDNTSVSTSYTWHYGNTWQVLDPIRALTLYTRNLSQFEVDTRFDLFGILPRMVNP